jgi:molybdate transport system ATP-binding protein
MKGMLEVDVRFARDGFLLDARLTATPGGVTALLGRSGAGKTSLLELVAGLARPLAGRIAAGEQLLFDSERGVDLPAHRRRVGYVFQDGRLFPHLSVRGNLRYGLCRAPVAERYVSLEEAIRLLDLGRLLRRRPATLSGGERQRVAIGRALLTSPRVLLLDEPLASLDAAHRTEILSFLERIPRAVRAPIVYVTHRVDEVLRLAERVVQLDAGRVVSSGTIDELAAGGGLEPAARREA